MRKRSGVFLGNGSKGFAAIEAASQIGWGQGWLRAHRNLGQLQVGPSYLLEGGKPATHRVSSSLSLPSRRRSHHRIYLRSMTRVLLSPAFPQDFQDQEDPRQEGQAEQTDPTLDSHAHWKQDQVQREEEAMEAYKAWSLNEVDVRNSNHT